MITAQALEEFKKIYEQEYGKRLSDAEASEKASTLLDLFRELTVVEKEFNNEIKRT